MRLQRHLNEMATELSIKEVLDFAYKNCQPFLKQTVKKGKYASLMYSGRSHNAKTFTRKVQQERQPLDTPPTVHKVLDLKFQKAFGVKARSQSIFCTGRSSLAALYGHPFLIFPMGKFKYLYHPEIKDLYNHIRFTIMFDLDVSSIEDFEVFEDRIDQLVKEYKNKDLVKGVESGNEIMVQCREYFAVSEIYAHSLNNWYRKNGNIEPTDENIQKVFGSDTTSKGLKLL